MDAVLRVENLTVAIPTKQTVLHPVNDVTFGVAQSEMLGVVGESGSGKSVSTLSLTRLLPKSSRMVVRGSVEFEGRNLLTLGDRELADIRGRRIGYIFQDSQAALDPLMTCGDQLAEGMRRHMHLTKRRALDRAAELLEAVGLPDSVRRLDDYPHQLSGGMRQRVMIATALSCEPSIIIADEPTTALDVIMQAQILALFHAIRRSRGTSIVFISHDLGLVSEIADRVAVMYGGRIVEVGLTRDMVARPRHPYTQGLLRSIPSLIGKRVDYLPTIDGLPPDPGHLPPGCPFTPRCSYRIDRCNREMPPLESVDAQHEVACWVRPDFAIAPTVQGEDQQAIAQRLRAEEEKHLEDPQPAEPLVTIDGLSVDFGGSHTWLRHEKSLRAVDSIDLRLRRHRTTALVGESGSGKSTLARALAGLTGPAEGTITFDGRRLFPDDTGGWRPIRRQIQMIFQDPNGSLNPRMTASDLVGEAIDIYHSASSVAERRERINSLLTMVNIDPEFKDRFPHQFSGGQKQRIAIARALAADPTLLICDEPVTSLDVSIQGQVLNVLSSLQRNLGLTYLFIAHDLTLVRHFAHDTYVMYLAKIVESGPTEKVINQPRHPYTAALRAASPMIERRVDVEGLIGEIPSAADPPSGCRFRTRCPYARSRCAEEEPMLRLFDGRLVACHFAEEIASRATA